MKTEMYKGFSITYRPGMFLVEAYATGRTGGWQRVLRASGTTKDDARQKIRRVIDRARGVSNAKHN